MMREAELEEMEKKWKAENERIMREHPLRRADGSRKPDWAEPVPALEASRRRRSPAAAAAHARRKPEPPPRKRAAPPIPAGPAAPPAGDAAMTDLDRDRAPRSRGPRREQGAAARPSDRAPPAAALVRRRRWRSRSASASISPSRSSASWSSRCSRRGRAQLIYTALRGVLRRDQGRLLRGADGRPSRSSPTRSGSSSRPASTARRRGRSCRSCC